MDQYIGRLLDDRYEILEVIGTGGMAVVYKARCHRLNRLVAIKILKDEFARDEEFRRRFRAEGEAVAMLSHPNIVQVYDVSSSDSANYIVMELIDGISLKQYMEKKGVLNWKETLHFAMQIAKGLEHAHSRGIIHRDIKPHNVMVLKNGSVKVMDFGIARVMSKSNTLTKEALGSVHYISPEQAKGGHTDNRSDIYSLGVVMYEMMTGRPPYDGESPVAVAIQHINGGAPLPSTLNPNIPRGLEQIIMKSMALEVNDRYTSATEMLQDMEEFRKNPDMTFHYHSMVDDATRIIPNITRAMTTAEKKVQAKTGVPPVRTSPDSIRLHQSSGSYGTGIGKSQSSPVAGRDNESIRRAQQRRQAQQQQRKDERSRVATTAIVVCSAVAVIAIFIFLIALFNGALLSKEKALVEVPYLEGDLYSENLAFQYPDFEIKLRQEYNDDYAEGQIIHTEPTGGSKVVKGSELWITVSLGQGPEAKIMDDFVGTSAEEAKSILVGQGFKPITRNEISYVYDAGQVVRTEPSAGAEMTAGQTVYIYVSTGPDIVTAKMLNVMGLDVSRAIELLGQSGFNNVKTDEVESLKPKGEVIHQSVMKNEEIDVTTEIVLQVSKGPEETTAPTETDPPSYPQEPVTVGVQFSLPDKEEAYILSIFLNGKEVIESQEILPGTSSFVCNLTGNGKQTYDVYIDGEYYQSKDVNFN
ncbi:MAG: Stk1 family PASTA domain-containing Ser/Thr kinase [Faecousia sp.]